ncbi:MAG: hypothetical protein ACRDTJ_09850 [Pseudonocardiaceae bacterium]
MVLIIAHVLGRTEPLTDLRLIAYAYIRALFVDEFEQDDPVSVAIRWLVPLWTRFQGERAGLSEEYVDHACAVWDGGARVVGNCPGVPWPGDGDDRGHDELSAGHVHGDRDLH